MSFLSILFFATAFYVAHAKPQSPADPEAAVDIAPAEAVPESPQAPSAPIMDATAYQSQISGFMQVMSKAIDQYMTPMMTKLKTQEQAQLKTMGMNGFASYVNYLWPIIKQKENENATGNDDDEDYGIELNQDDIIIEFDPLNPIDPSSPFIAEGFGMA